MHNYELVTVISPEADDEKITGIMDKMNKFINDKDGIVEETERWGTKKLAYPIKRFMEASYILTRFKLEPGFVIEFEANIRASQEILRHLIVKVGD